MVKDALFENAYITAGLMCHIFIQAYKKEKNIKRVRDPKYKNEIVYREILKIFNGRSNLWITNSKTSKFLNCENNGDAYGFTDINIKDIDNRIRENDSSLYIGTKKLLDKYFDDEDTIKWLITIFIELINADDSIGLEEEIKIAPSKYIRKKHIKETTEIEAESFVLSALVLSLKKEYDKEKGRETFLCLFAKDGYDDVRLKNETEEKKKNKLWILKNEYSSYKPAEIRLLRYNNKDTQDRSEDLTTEQSLTVNNSKIDYIKQLKELYVSSIFDNTYDFSKAVDLNSNPDALEGTQTEETVFKYTSAYDIRRRMTRLGTQILVSTKIGEKVLDGYTSLKNWQSESYLNNIIINGNIEFTAYFWLIDKKNEGYTVQYLKIGMGERIIC